MLTPSILLLTLNATVSAPRFVGVPPAPTAPAVRVAQGGEWRAQPPAPPPGNWHNAPPPPAPERVRPRRGWVWVEGGYDWRDGQYVRLRGHWERARPGRQWHSGHWEWRGDRYAWVAGTWLDAASAPAVPPNYVVENPAPPPPPPAQIPPPPPARPGFVWIPGAQEWRGDRYVWVEGHWEREHPGDNWHAGHWDRDGERHAWHSGGWEHGDRGPGPGPGSSPPGGLAISGRIVDQMGRPAAGITVVLAGSSEARAVTDGDGQYVFSGLAPGSYAVRPNDPRCGFGPDVVNLNNLGSNAVRNFNASCR